MQSNGYQPFYGSFPTEMVIKNFEKKESLYNEPCTEHFQKDRYAT